MKPERNGIFWIKISDPEPRWIVAEFNDGDWYVIGSEVALLPRRVAEVEIGPEIVRPDNLE